LRRFGITRLLVGTESQHQPDFCQIGNLRKGTCLHPETLAKVWNYQTIGWN
jgi:hypothetical protein